MSHQVLTIAYADAFLDDALRELVAKLRAERKYLITKTRTFDTNGMIWKNRITVRLLW